MEYNVISNGIEEFNNCTLDDDEYKDIEIYKEEMILNLKHQKWDL